VREYEIVDTNAENIGGCSFCGRKNPNNKGYRRKSDWLKKRYPEGLRLKVLRSREFGDIGTFEYVLGNIIYDGKLIVDRPISGTRFASIMSKALGSPLTGPAAVSRMRLVRQNNASHG
jgi:hypothetical protein